MTNENKHPLILPSPLGNLGIQLTENKLSSIDFLPTQTQLISPQNEITHLIAQELKTYFQEAHHLFNLPLRLIGTPFQHTVWQALRTIPVGHTLTYGELAKQLNTSARAIGNACRSNPIPIIIPCHRIVAKKSLGGYTGKTTGTALTIKKWLLHHEGL